MNRIIEIIRKVVQQELARDRNCLLGVVTSIFPHDSQDDANNYEVNVRLKHENLELQKVPVAVGHIGTASLPKIGDLVLVQFINGDINSPVITGRFYHDEERPPLHQADEILLEHRVAEDKTLNHLRFAANGTIYLQRDVTKPEDNSEAKTSLKIDGPSGNIELKAGKISITVINDTDIQVIADETNIQITGQEIKIADVAENSIEMKQDQFKISAKVPFTIDASGQPVVIIAKTIDFNQG
ncbi:phage baseplate assembly protein V [Tolypothrix bouteillei VB521301_2]|uniref:phage baseplate assembly protein V n=1 Tax=Tolypothrix bouteillei TaxID=1246981 RepID=UPI0005138FE7